MSILYEANGRPVRELSEGEELTFRSERGTTTYTAHPDTKGGRVTQVSGGRRRGFRVRGGSSILLPEPGNHWLVGR